MANEQRLARVVAVLGEINEAIGPTEIARRIDEAWCVMNFDSYGPRSRKRPQSNAINPLLEILIARGDVAREAGGKYRIARKRK